MVLRTEVDLFIEYRYPTKRHATETVRSSNPTHISLHSHLLRRVGSFLVSSLTRRFVSPVPMHRSSVPRPTLGHTRRRSMNDAPTRPVIHSELPRKSSFMGTLPASHSTQNRNSWKTTTERPNRKVQRL